MNNHPHDERGQHRDLQHRTPVEPQQPKSHRQGRNRLGPDGPAHGMDGERPRLAIRHLLGQHSGGASVVEAANKVLVTQRLKWSGMCRKIDGGQAVLTFRALIKSDRFGHGMGDPDGVNHRSRRTTIRIQRR